MRLSKRQLKRIIREEYTRLKRRGLIKESYDGVATIIDDFNYAREWYEFMLNGLPMYGGPIKGSEMNLYNFPADLIEYGYDPDTAEGMVEDQMIFEEHCEEEFGMRLSRCWDIFFSEMSQIR